MALDEECSLEIYTECLAQISATGGMLMAVFTPLLGMTDVVRRYMEEESPDRFYCQMTIDQAEHISEEYRQKIIDGYPAHEKEARLKGIPSLGSGRIYTTPEEQFLIDPIEIPKHWPRLIALDLGLDENFAAVLVAWDRDTDTTYLMDTYKGSKGDVQSVHASRIKEWGDWIPVVWPHDAGMKDRTTGKSFKQLLRVEGLRMTKGLAQLSDGGISVEAGIMTVQQRLRDGRFRVFRHLEDFLKEYRTYHRDQTGKIVKQRDHIQDATRYALVSLRMGRVKAIVRKLDYSRMPVVY